LKGAKNGKREKKAKRKQRVLIRTGRKGIFPVKGATFALKEAGIGWPASFIRGSRCEGSSNHAHGNTREGHGWPMGRSFRPNRGGRDIPGGPIVHPAMHIVKSPKPLSGASGRRFIAILPISRPGSSPPIESGFGPEHHRAAAMLPRHPARRPAFLPIHESDPGIFFL
jgi:hypothetical protein